MRSSPLRPLTDERRDNVVHALQEAGEVLSGCVVRRSDLSYNSCRFSSGCLHAAVISQDVCQAQDPVHLLDIQQGLFYCRSGNIFFLIHILFILTYLSYFFYSKIARKQKYSCSANGETMYMYLYFTVRQEVLTDGLSLHDIQWPASSLVSHVSTLTLIVNSLD